LFAIIVLTIISLVRQVRQHGVGETSFEKISFLPSDGLAEMGASLRPVSAVIEWTDRGDDFLFGSSYLAPLDRILVYFIPGWTRPPIYEDKRVMGNVIGKRVGAVGFSMIAEAYINFSAVGVFTFMFLMGAFLARIECCQITLYRQMQVGVIILPLFMFIRNSFIFVPATTAIGLLCVFLIKKISVSNHSRF
jgi:oligosaccharide repeat unit polymerase